MAKRLTPEQRAIRACYEHKAHPEAHFADICCVVCEPFAKEIRKAIQNALKREKYYHINGRLY